ncbi:DNA helicase IV [Kribbella sp. VKM Ac-2571]|uniref:HelD family protein n=1 Tax=Kribbella sp. VKM Ac-2571 TaxID=2512222 RepID=UPI00105BDEF2|nr:AAA family ATPase [Kribbella sp. VKM Ac-2571]TDO47019.1 DNA helicase IV [Kribbella sp. VKM Ac-2571]
MKELDEERAYADRCRDALRRMVAGARENVVVGEGTWGDRYTAERLGFYLKTLARDMGEEGDNPPFFGVIAYGATDPAAGEHRRQTYYLGRRHISDAIGRPPMVIDWRAPVSASFYQASAVEPRGIDVRRRFGWSGNRLTSFEDEHLRTSSGDGSGGGSGDGFGGSASELVRREIERARVGPMRDIVATIQPEQDTLVRTGLDVSVCIQGAPGTGKTAVGLHRAAYLLYAHRSRLERNGVLVLGPNRAFLHYISAVLPTLGEVDVEQTTIEQLLDREVRAVDDPIAAAIKHDVRMAEVLRRAVYGRIGRPAQAVVVRDESYKWRVSQHEFAEMVDEAEADATTYSTGRERVIARLVAAVQRQAEARGQNCNGVWLRRMARGVTPYVEEVWPALKADEVLAEYLSDPSQVGILTAEEQRAIAWSRPRKAKSARWTAADAVLLDEVSALLERSPTYGHVIVDEAQDLSPMQCRAIARRSEHTSITVLGDLAQGTTAWAADDWATQLRHLGKPAAEIVALSTGYRVPGTVVELANRLLDALDVAVPPTRSFRSDGELTITRVDDVAAACVESIRRALSVEGSIGVIAADHHLPAVSDALKAAGIESSAADGDGRVAVVPASLAKGLEYDHVIALEPSEIVASETRGLNRLYVVLTRAVSRLDILHSRELPPELT